MGLQVCFADCAGQIENSSNATTIEHHAHQQRETQSAEMLHGKVWNLPVHAGHPGAAHAEVRYGHR